MAPAARAAAAAAIALATFMRAWPPKVAGTAPVGAIRVERRPWRTTISSPRRPSSSTMARPPRRQVSTSSLPSSMEKYTSSPEQCRRIPATSGSSALRPAASRGHGLDHHLLDRGQLLEGVDAAQAEVVGADVEDHPDVVALSYLEAFAQDPAPGHLEHGEVDPGVLQHHPGRARPEASAVTTSRLSIRMPSVEVRPTWRPIP